MNAINLKSGHPNTLNTHIFQCYHMNTTLTHNIHDVPQFGDYLLISMHKHLHVTLLLSKQIHNKVQALLISLTVAWV